MASVGVFNNKLAQPAANVTFYNHDLQTNHIHEKQSDGQINTITDVNKQRGIYYAKIEI